MALTSPFINTISAFDANIGTNIEMYVKGGDAITKYQFYIYNDADVLLYTSPQITLSTADVAGFNIRGFPISITRTMGTQSNILNNNNSYKIKPKTFNNSQPDGQEGNIATFMCYETPVIKLQYLTGNGYVDLTNGNTMTTSIPMFKIVFKNNDIVSKAKPNEAKITLYGVNADGTEDYINDTNSLYRFTHTEIGSPNENYYIESDLSGFSVNLDDNSALKPNAQYVSFKVRCCVQTVENMQSYCEYTGLKCYYKILGNSPYLVVNNLYNEGIVQVNCELTSFQGESNIDVDDLVYINQEELNLRPEAYDNQDVYVRWRKFFTLGQPYTLRIWGRNFKIGEIATMTSSIYSGKYVRLEYKTQGNYTFISLYSAQNNDDGQSMFPYYIESERILTSTITENTNLFIGVQEEDGLFSINFEILT